MKTIGGVLILLSVSLFVEAGNGSQCDFSDPDLIFCPKARAPDGFQLKEGFVVVEYTVQKDGSIHRVRVMDSDKFGHWRGPAVSAVSRWRYRPQLQVARKSRRLVFTFSEDR